jgi:hypothetical protein
LPPLARRGPRPTLDSILDITLVGDEKHWRVSAAKVSNGPYAIFRRASVWKHPTFPNESGALCAKLSVSGELRRVVSHSLILI